MIYSIKSENGFPYNFELSFQCQLKDSVLFKVIDTFALCKLSYFFTGCTYVNQQFLNIMRHRSEFSMNQPVSEK